MLPERLHSETQFIITHLSSLLRMVANIDVSRHSDTDGTKLDMKTLDDPGKYIRSVEKARLLVSNLQSAVEDLYLDASTLFTTVQKIQTDEQVSSIYTSPRDNQIKAPATSIMANLSVVLSSLESLLTHGNEQAAIVDTAQMDLSQSDRDSCISIVDGNTYTGPAEEFNVEEALIKPLVRVASSPDDPWANFGSPLSSTSSENLSNASQDRLADLSTPATPPRSHRRISGAETLVGSLIGSLVSSNASTLPPEDESLFLTSDSEYFFLIFRLVFAHLAVTSHPSREVSPKGGEVDEDLGR